MASEFRNEIAALSPRPRALEEADRVRLVQDRRRGGPVVFGEVGDVAHRRVLSAGDRGVEPRRLRHFKHEAPVRRESYVN